MKIKKIIDLCKKEKRLILIDKAENEQWISDGAAIYPLYDLPRFDEDTICKTFDIPPKKAQEIVFNHLSEPPKAYDFSDYREGDVEAMRWDIGLIDSGRRLIPFSTSQGILFVNEKYLAPFSDYDETMLSFCGRTNEAGQIYFAVKAGFVLVGIVLPMERVDKSLVEELGKLHQGCQVALRGKEGKEE